MRRRMRRWRIPWSRAWKAKESGAGRLPDLWRIAINPLRHSMSQAVAPATLIDEIGHTLTGQRIRRSLDLEMDMRFARISGVSNLRQNLTAPHVLPC